MKALAVLMLIVPTAGLLSLNLYLGQPLLGIGLFAAQLIITAPLLLRIILD